MTENKAICFLCVVGLAILTFVVALTLANFILFEDGSFQLFHDPDLGGCLIRALGCS